MSACVVDASVVGQWLLVREPDPGVTDVMSVALTYGAQVPALFPFEVANMLARRSAAVSPEAATLAAAQVARWPLAVDAQTPDIPVLMEVARESGLTAYDAAYLELALRSECPLATVDQRLVAAARSVGVVVLP